MPAPVLTVLPVIIKLKKVKKLIEGPAKEEGRGQAARLCYGWKEKIAGLRMCKDLLQLHDSQALSGTKHNAKHRAEPVSNDREGIVSKVRERKGKREATKERENVRFPTGLASRGSCVGSSKHAKALP